MQRYNSLQIVLHWASAALILLSLVFGTVVLKHLPNDATKIVPLLAHAIVGLVVGLMIAVRLILRFTTRQPERVKTGSLLLDRLAIAVHGAMYIAVIGMVSSGVGMAVLAGFPATLLDGHGAALPVDFWIYPPRLAHALFARLLMALVGLHVAAALYHQVVRKDGLLTRMWFARN